MHVMAGKEAPAQENADAQLNRIGAFTRQLSEDAVQADVEGSWTKAQNSVFRIAKFTAHFNNLAIRSQNTWVTIS